MELGGEEAYEVINENRGNVWWKGVGVALMVSDKVDTVCSIFLRMAWWKKSVFLSPFWTQCFL